MRKIFLRFAMITVFLLCESVAPSILKYAHSFKIPDTDQRRCFQALYPYDEITCPASGNPLAQDGSYITYPLSYTDNGNGTVSDNNTGLTWQRKDDSKTRTWADASTYCANLKLGNHDDWRLPSMDELMSIVDYAIPAPGPTIHSFFKNTKASEYWTTAYRSVNFNDGAVYYYSRGQHYVRCVRGTQWQQEFLDMGNGTVTDLRTRLRWQQGEPGSMTWDKALSYCEGLSLAGLKRWRLPNIKELESIFDSDKIIDKNFFPGAFEERYWSSTNNSSDPSDAWAFEFDYDADISYRDKSANYYVRCVHKERTSGPDIVTPSPSYGSYIGSPFDLNTAFIHKGSDIKSCEYTIDGTTWNPATVTGTNPVFFCTATGITGTNGQVLVLNMRATSKEGTETAKAITRKIDIKPPIKGSVFTASAGKGQCTLAWSEASDSGSGMNISIPYEVRYQVGADPGSCKGGNPAYIGTALNSVHKGLLSSMKFYYRLCYKDNLGNTSQYSGNPVTCTPKANVSGAYDLPDTRQTACYDQNGTVITCPAQDQSLAQDGSYDIPLSYTDHGNGTVTDNNTGLIWQKRDDGRRYNWYRASGTYHKTYNPSSYNTCGQLLLGGYSNWRLPSKIELMTLVDYGISNSSPKINTTYFPDTKDDYLTVTSFAGDIEKSWIVGFGNGGIAPTSKAKESSVRCVRGEQLDFGNFRDNHDGTVTDKKSGLMWQQDEPGRMTWTQALSYCESLILGKHSDWRLPNFKELQSLANENGAYPAINKIYFPNANCNTSYISAYWSSTTYNSYKNGAYVTDFYDGTFYGGGKWGNPYTRCVRGGPDPFIKAPSNLTAKAVSSEEIDLNWKDNSGNETGFRLQRKKGNCSSTNSWVDLNTTISANSVFFRHSAAAANTQYAYRIRAYNATGYSAYSNCASAKTELE